MTACRIVVLDGFSLNPGDLSWAGLEALGSVSVFDRTPPDQIVERAAGAAILLTNKTVIDEPTLSALPELRYIGVLATGTNIVDRDAARARGVVVTNVPSYAADSVAEHTFALMLDGMKHLSAHVLAVREGGWSRQADFSFTVAPIRLLAGKALGIVGFGSIGRRVAELGLAFKMTVLVASHGASTEASSALGIGVRELDDVFRQSDVLSLHCPLTPATQHLVDARRLALMKPGALLINTARGGLVDELALAVALRSGKLGGACLDVLGAEPPPQSQALLSAPRCLVTPHIAWASVEGRRRLLEIATENVRAFMAGAPVNVV